MSHPHNLTNEAYEALYELARAYTECHVEYEEDETADGIYDEWLTIAYDYLRDKGVVDEVAGYIAGKLAQGVAQP